MNTLNIASIAIAEKALMIIIPFTPFSPFSMLSSFHFIYPICFIHFWRVLLLDDILMVGEVLSIGFMHFSKYKL